MPTVQSAVTEENERLKREFTNQGLDLAPVWQPTPDDLRLENEQLRELLAWVCAYRDCPDRSTLIKRGYHYPPIDPDIDPKTDWLRFERWLQGQPLAWNFVRECGALPDPETITDAQIMTAMERVFESLAQRGVCVDVAAGIPDRVLYTWLRHELAIAEFEVTAPGTWCHIGCAACCAACFQQPWCDVARELARLEHEPQATLPR